MRRKDREITDMQTVNDIILSCDCCRVGFMDGVSPYIVPLNFGYTFEQGKGTFYFHSALEGRKLELLKMNPRVGFELDTHHALHEGEQACDFAFRFRSVIGTGVATLVEDIEEKKNALRIFMRHLSTREDWAFTDAQASSVAVIRLDVLEMACKEHL